MVQKVERLFKEVKSSLGFRSFSWALGIYSKYLTLPDEQACWFSDIHRKLLDFRKRNRRKLNQKMHLFLTESVLLLQDSNW